MTAVQISLDVQVYLARGPTFECVSRVCTYVAAAKWEVEERAEDGKKLLAFRVKRESELLVNVFVRKMVHRTGDS